MKRSMLLSFITIVSVISLITGCASQNADPKYSFVEGDVKKQMEEASVVLRAVGKGIPPENAISKGQATLMAERAAVADGYRKLVEKVRGVFIDAYSRIGDGVIDYDIVYAETQSWIKGAEVIKMEKMENDIYEAHMRIRISVAKDSTLWNPIKNMSSEM